MEIGSSTTEVIKKKKSSLGRRLFLVLFLVLVFRSSILEPFRIPSGSMIPSLLSGDFVLVNKMAYGLKIPFSDWLSEPVYLFGKSPPERGDVIVFKYPKDQSVNYIKRVVGLPGDKIKVKNKKLFINGAEVVGIEISPICTRLRLSVTMYPILATELSGSHILSTAGSVIIARRIGLRSVTVSILKAFRASRFVAISGKVIPTIV